MGEIPNNKLETLVLFAFHHRLNKEIDHSKWEARELSPRHLSYAATDAYAVIALYLWGQRRKTPVANRADVSGDDNDGAMAQGEAGGGATAAEEEEGTVCSASRAVVDEMMPRANIGDTGSLLPDDGADLEDAADAASADTMGVPLSRERCDAYMQETAERKAVLSTLESDRGKGRLPLPSLVLSYSSCVRSWALRGCCAFWADGMS